jgi:CO dehydrogenase maturation factor
METITIIIQSWQRKKSRRISKMRIAFLGKGGAGKTTTTAGFVKYLATRHSYVLAIDADVNAHLKGALQLDNMQGELIQLGSMRSEVAEYVRGARKDLGDRPLIHTTPPSLQSTFIKVSREDSFIQKYGRHAGNISLLTVGSYNESDVGKNSCYHTKLGSLANIFHHLLDSTDDLVVADTTAGTDNVATSLCFAYDINVFVVEPTEKSLKVYLDFISLADHLKEKTYVLANKIDNSEDESFIRQHVDADKFLASVPQSKNLKRFEQGSREALLAFESEQKPAFDKVFDAWKKTKRDWDLYLSQLREAHAVSCSTWYDSHYGMKLNEGLDEQFRYQLALDQNNRSIGQKQLVEV